MKNKIIILQNYSHFVVYYKLQNKKPIHDMYTIDLKCDYFISTDFFTPNSFFICIDIVK